ncbi:MAG: CHAT domain-containing protein [Crocosphaera sp.]
MNYQLKKHSKFNNDWVMVINFGTGNLIQGFPYITVQLWSNHSPFPQQFTANLPFKENLEESYSKWKQEYNAINRISNNTIEEYLDDDDDDEEDLEEQENYDYFLEKDDESIDSFSHQLQESLNDWLNHSDFIQIIEQINKILEKNQVKLLTIILDTDNNTLKRLPWNSWQFLTAYPKSEISLSRSHYIREEINIKIRKKVRVLAIIGNSEGINMEEEKQWLNQLPDAEIIFLDKPSKQQFKNSLSDAEGWDILFFAGHSKTEENTGILSINESQNNHERDITIHELRSNLKEAIKNGLQLAIFNSCDGLGIGDGLASLYIPITIIMREPVPNKVAQVFFHEFLESYANKNLSLYIAVKNAKKKLETIEDNYIAASWLPMIFQNPAFSPPSWVELGGSSPCPYLGLDAFQETNYDLFFGREKTINKLQNLVKTNPFISLVGASGSGKSSIIFAGLIPKLRQDNDKNWRISWFRPQTNPFDGLAKAFSQLTNNSADRLEELKLEINFENDTTAISNYLNQIIQNSNYSSHLLLVIDQFEELFTSCDKSDIEAFLQGLLTAINTVDKFTVIITLRADFLGYLLDSVEWGELLQKYSPEYITSMNREELKSAIINPAVFNGVKLEDKLVDQLIDDVHKEAGYLPLLQFTLKELWKQQKKGWLTYKDYQEIGGVKTALANHSEKVYKTFSQEEQKEIEKIFIQLVTIKENNEPTRKIITKENNLIRENWYLITHLASSRLVITNSLEKEITVEISHEKLITAWPRYYEWIKENKEFLRWRSQLSNNINQWKESKITSLENKKTRDDPKSLLSLPSPLKMKLNQWENNKKTKGYLLKDTPLIKANIWYKERQEDLEQEQKEFIKNSLKVRRNQRIILSVLTTAVIGTISLTGVFAWIQSKERQLEELIRYASSQVITPETANTIMDVLPNYLNKAKQQEKEQKIEQAMDDYRQILRVANNTYEKIEQDSQEFNKSVIMPEKLKNISQEAESSLVEMIAKYRLPKLEKQLNNKDFGERNIPTFLNPDTGNKEDEYTKRVYTGALKTTHDIIMTDRGVKTDQNNDNIIDEGEENSIPCETLIQIEKLWREATDNQCGWYGIDNISNSNCQLFAGETLTTILVPTFDFSLLAKRLEYCKIIPVSEQFNES